jgi:hypothetical protein
MPLADVDSRGSRPEPVDVVEDAGGRGIELDPGGESQVKVVLGKHSPPERAENHWEASPPWWDSTDSG